MSIDVKAEIVINRSREDVASFAMNSDNDPIWIGGIVESKMLTDSPLGKGTNVSRVAKFLGKRIEYINEIIEYDPAGLLVMRSIKGPFPMTIRYQFEDASGGTLARIHVQGESSGFYKLAAPLLARAVKGNVKNDLETLKDLLESKMDRP